MVSRSAKNPKTKAIKIKGNFKCRELFNLSNEWYFEKFIKIKEEPKDPEVNKEVFRLSNEYYDNKFKTGSQMPGKKAVNIKSLKSSLIRHLLKRQHDVEIRLQQ